MMCPEQTSPDTYPAFAGGADERGRHAGPHGIPSGLRAVLAVFMVLLCLLPLAAQAAERAQARRLYMNVNGDMTMIGNMLVHCDPALTGTKGTACSNARTSGTQNADNYNTFSANTDFVLVDADADASTTNSSSSILSMPAGSRVVWAGLYWGSRYNTSSSTTLVALSTANASIKFRTPAMSGYQTIAPTTLDTSASGSSASGMAFQAFADVTPLVQAAGNGNYWGGGLTASAVALARNAWAGWALVVVYENAALPFRNFAVYDGLEYISAKTVTMTPSGFLTPLSGPVASRLGVLLWDGDKQAPQANESFLLNGFSMTNAANPQGDVWNSTISNLGVNVTSRNPAYPNTLGMDLDMFNVPTGLIPNGATSATIGIQSPGTGEIFWYGMAGFVTDIYVPVVIPNVVKTAEDMSPETPLLRGDTLRWKVVMSNTGFDGATNLIATDVIPPHLTYKPGSLVIATGANAGAKTDAAGDDQAEYLTTGGSNRVVFRLGTGANATQGGTLAYNQSTSFYFDTIVNNDVPAGTLLTNQVQIQYNSQTLPATTFAASSAAASATIMGPPAIAKSFSPHVVDIGQSSVLTITLSNPPGNPEALTNVTFSDTYPAGLVNTSNPNPQVNCTPGSTAGTVTGGAVNGNTIGLNPGATIAPNGVCLVTVNVTASAINNYLNTTSPVASGNSGMGGTASATLSVGKPRISKAFAPSSILVGGSSTITFTLQNLAGTALTGVAFSDVLTNMTVKAPLVSSNTCGGTLTAAGNNISLSGGALSAYAGSGTGSCTITVVVTSTTPGVLPNTTTGVTSTQSGVAGNPSNTAELTVIAPPLLTKAFGQLSVRTGAPVPMVLTVSNPNISTTMTGVAFTDGVSPAYPAGLGNSSPADAVLSCTLGSSATLTGGADGGSNVGLSGGTLAPGGSCTITLNVQSSSTGTKSNTTSQVSTANAGNGLAATAVLEVSNNLGATKAFTTPIAYNSTSLPAASATYSTMTITLSKAATGNANNVGFEDEFPIGLYVAAPVTIGGTCGGSRQGRTGNGAWGPVVAGNTALRASAVSVPGSGSCTITVRVTSDEAAFYTNTIANVYSDNAGDTGPVSGTLNVLGPPQVSKGFNPAAIPRCTSNCNTAGNYSELSLMVSNPSTATVALSNVVVTDDFPANLVLSGTNTTFSPTGCGTLQGRTGTGAWTTLAANQTGVRLTVNSLASNATCVATVRVRSGTAGNYDNQTEPVTSGNGGTGGVATASLSVGQVDVAKSLCTANVSNAIASDATCAMTLAFTNSSGSSQSGVVLIDDFPGQTPSGGDFTLANTTLGGTCSATGRTLQGYTGSNNSGSWSAAAAGNTGIRLTVTVPTAGCTVTVNVKSARTLTNTIRAGQVTVGGLKNSSDTSATLYVAEPLQVQKSFSVASIAVGGTADMTIRLTNLNAVDTNAVSFTDIFPAGLVLAGPVSGNTCGTLGTVVQGTLSGTWTTPAAGHTRLRMNGGTLAGGNICEITVPVTSTVAGVYENSTGTVTTSNIGNSPEDKATLVVMGPPAVAKAFTPDAIQVGEASLLTIMLTNANTTAAITGAAFTDTYPAGMVNDATPNAASSCPGGTVTAVPGGNTLALANASIPAGGSCTVSVRVTSASATPAGTPYTNNTGTVTTTNAGNGASASAQLTVNPLLPILNLVKQVSVLSDPVNNTTNPKAIPGAQMTYVIRITNTGPGKVDANTLFLDDPLPAHVDLFVGTGPALSGFAFTNGSPVSGLTACTFGNLNNGSDCVDFSTDGSNWTYTPSPDANGYDPAIRYLRFRPSGPFNASVGGNPWAEFSFRVRVR